MPDDLRLILLERRTFLSSPSHATATFSDGVLVIAGNAVASTHITLELIGKPLKGTLRSASLRTTVDRKNHAPEVTTIALSEIRRVRITCGGGDDIVEAKALTFPARNSKHQAQTIHIQLRLEVDGGAGADMIDASGLAAPAGVDEHFVTATLRGGDGDDVITGSAGRNEIDGDAGNDLITGGDARDSLLGGAGNDVLRGGNANDTLIGDVGDDTLAGGAGADLLYGGSGNDEVNGGTRLTRKTPRRKDDASADKPDDPHTDTLYGGDGHDTLFLGKDDHYQRNGAGGDEIPLL